MKKIKCPICEGLEVIVLPNFKNYNFCLNCRTAWQIKFSKAIYKEDYYSGKSSLISKLFDPITVVFHKIRESYVKPGQKKLWIDVGAGEGNFLSTVSAQEKIGVEISKAGRKLMEDKGLETLGPEEFLKEKHLNADVISFWHVLEHVENPWDYIKSAHCNLSKNGQIVIAVPNIDSFDFRYFGKYWFHLAPNFHLWHYSHKSLEVLLSKNKFKISRTDWWSPEHHLVGLLQSFINRTTKSDNFLHQLIRRESGFKSITVKNVAWSIFWLTLGAPLIVTVWMVNSLTHKSGAIIIVASKR